MPRAPGSTSWDGAADRAEAAMSWLSRPVAADVEEIVYHRGDLAIDAPPRPDVSNAALRVRMCARRMQRAAGMGLVRLLQRRHGEHDYEYIARRWR